MEVSEYNVELVIDVLSAAVEYRNFSVGRHIGRVRTLARILMNTWNELYPDEAFTEVSIQKIAMASSIYDIGKVAIPENILLKPGRLTYEEFEIVKTHTICGCDLLERFKGEDSEFYGYCYDICRYHHERVDGSGYPNGLREGEIPLWAQIISIIDVFDALISPRVYKAPYTINTAFEMIQNGECGAFSEKLLRCFAESKDLIINVAERN